MSGKKVEEGKEEGTEEGGSSDMQLVDI